MGPFSLHRLKLSKIWVELAVLNWRLVNINNLSHEFSVGKLNLGSLFPQHLEMTK